ncbi:MAG: PEP/pyruvate-binding domain-containing protein [Atribacterota bacterium]|nr:PEP/pyruvate-binding domain-containing protein [Atribacterota bacterium]MDD5636785.1 PEP/pyruvate-binding domain-containing protein [Atribacterota bacterium]
MPIIQKDTRQVVKDKNLSTEQKWLLDISSAYFGIHQRIINFLTEIYLSPLRPKFVHEKLREIALNDMWFYKSHPEASRAIKAILTLFNDMLNKELNFRDKQRVLETLFEFIRELAKDDYMEVELDFLAEEVFHILDKTLHHDKDIRIYSSSLLKKLPTHLTKHRDYSRRMENLLRVSLKENIQIWKNQLDFQEWCQKQDKYFSEKYKVEILNIAKREKQFISEMQEKLSQAHNWEELDSIPDFKECIAKLIGYLEKDASILEKIHFLYYLLEIPEMMGLRDSLLVELAQLYKRFAPEDIAELPLNSFLTTTFSLFNSLKTENMEKILECLLRLGQGIYQTEDQTYIDTLIEHLIRFGFIYPGEVKINDDWQIQTDNNHLKIIRLWLELIKCSIRHSSKLISALIVNLKLGGVLIRDEDLFQRDVSKLLNSDIKSNYVLIKQLLSLFPVYFSAVGAEGKIRELSTDIDKLSYSEDRLIHFLRKQVHVESNNSQIELIRRIFCFWYDRNHHPLLEYLPSDVQKELSVSGKWFDPVHNITRKLCKAMKVSPVAMLEKDIDEIKKALEKIKNLDDCNSKRIIYLIELYQLLKHKYTLDYKFICLDLQKSNIFTIREIKKLENNIKNDKCTASIKLIYNMISRLKKIILESPKTEAQESIYLKRHIASGIPSMYGQYYEQKLVAMGLILRLEKLADYLISKLISQRNLDYMTIDGFHNAARILDLFKEGLSLNGISNENFNSHLEMLNYSFKTTTFSMDQFVNIFYFFTLNIKEIIDNYYILPFSSSLKTIIRQNIMGTDTSNKTNQEHIIYRKSEEFYRDIIVAAFLVQSLDNYVSKILSTLRNMMARLKPEVIHMLLNYNPKLLCTSLHKSNPKVDNQIFLGAKAYYLKKLYSYKFPIPPGFVLTTEWFRDRKAIMQFPEMYQAILGMIRDKLMELERITRKKFGDLKNPLFLAVRSGTVIPMPGAMDSILNIGMNDEIAESLSKIPEYGWAVWDSYRRLLQNWGMAHGIERDEFDKLILGFKQKYEVEEKRKFSKEQMKAIAFSYKTLLLDCGIKFEEDPFKQLIQAIILVFQSWYNDRAQIFRKKLQIAEEWGTAVIVQEMVFGNINTESGTGVFFTKVPFEKSSEVTLYGDFTSCSQGEDIVSGLVYTLPVSEFQNKKFPQFRGESLEKQFPEIYQELLRLAKELIYQRGYEHQEIEFTFKSKHRQDLYILQTRPYALKDKEKTPIFTSPDILSHLAGSGIGVGRGAMNGRVAFSLDDIRLLAERYPQEHKILIRPDTVPDDIEMIFECDGLLTSRGGVTSHAAVTAAQLGKVCVVNCKHLIVLEGEKKCIINNTEFKTGDKIAIDAYLGNIYKGHHAIDLEQISYFNEKGNL